MPQGNGSPPAWRGPPAFPVQGESQLHATGSVGSGGREAAGLRWVRYSSRGHGKETRKEVKWRGRWLGWRAARGTGKMGVRMDI